MDAFSSLSWPLDLPILDVLTANKLTTFAQFSVAPCIAFVQHLMQYLIALGELKSELALMIGKFVPALESLFGGMRSGIDSPPTILLLDSGRLGDLPLVDLLISPGFNFNLTGDVDSDLREKRTLYTFFAAGCMVMATLAGAWVVLARLSTGITTNLGTSVFVFPLTSIKDEGSEANAGAAVNGDARVRRGPNLDPRHLEPHDDERKDDGANNSDNGSNDDDDDPPPPSPGSCLHHDDDGTDESKRIGWSYLGVNFVLGFLVATMLKGLKMLQTKVRTQSHDGIVDVHEHVGWAFGKEWDVLEGTYGFSHSKYDGFTSRSNLPADILPSLTEPAGMSMVGVALLNEDVFSKNLWTRISKIWRVTSKVASTQPFTTIKVCLDYFLLGSMDFVVPVIPLIIAALKYRWDDTRKRHQSEHESLSEFSIKDGNREALRRSKRQEDEAEEEFVYFDQRITVPSNIGNGNNPEQINTSRAWSPSRPRIETYAIHYSELAEFIVRHEISIMNNLDEDCTTEGCVESLTREVEGLEGFFQVAHDMGTLIKDGEDETRRVAERTTFGDEDTDEEDEGLSDDLSDVEAYATADDGDVEMDGVNAQELVEVESLYDPCSDQESPRYIDDSNTEDEIWDSIRSLPGSFPVLLESVWGTRSNQWFIFEQLEELREREPLLASDAIEFGLSRSNLNAEASTIVDMNDVSRTPPQRNVKTFPSTPPPLPRGRKMRVRDKLLKEQMRRGPKQDNGSKCRDTSTEVY